MSSFIDGHDELTTVDMKKRTTSLSVSALWSVLLLICYLFGEAHAFLLRELHKETVCRQPPSVSTVLNLSSLSSSPQQQLPRFQVYSLSLNYTESNTIDAASFSSTVKEVWRWKDSVLGDGRDFFVPKPRTLAALNKFLLHGAASLLCSHQDDGSVDIKECLVLSNCARFEVLLVTERCFDTTLSFDPTMVVSELIVAQLESYRENHYNRWWTPPGDWPGIIDSDAASEWNSESKSSTTTRDDDDVVKELQRYWQVQEGAEDVLRHWSLIAAGMKTRPRRPDRPVLFRPFSSRDAHILLQLKRTLEIHNTDDASTRSSESNTTTTSSSKFLSIILQSALSAGKAARNADKVPMIEQLRAYGSGNSKYDQAVAPPELQQAVAKAVHQQAIEPSVRAGLSTWQSKTSPVYVQAIVKLRETAERLATSPSELVYIRQQLHEPTMRLRNQDDQVDVNSVLKDLHLSLAEFRVSEG